MSKIKTRVVMTKGNWVLVQETADEVKKRIESSEDGDIITLTRLTGGVSTPVYVMRKHIIYFSAY